MRTTLLQILLLMAVVASTAFAQNSDLGLLLGASPQVTGVSTPTSSTGKVDASGQINYAVQLHDSPKGRLYLELPLIITGTTIGTSTAATSTGISEAVYFFTPGIRWKFSPAARVSLYGAGGVGFVAVTRSVGFSSETVSNSYDTVGGTGAANIGCGLDFRLTRLVSLRADARELPTFARIRGAYHHEFFMLGVGLHF